MNGDNFQTNYIVCGKSWGNLIERSVYEPVSPSSQLAKMLIIQIIYLFNNCQFNVLSILLHRLCKMISLCNFIYS